MTLLFSCWETMAINVDIHLLFSHSLLFLLTHTDTDGLVSAGVTHDPFLCTEVKETPLHDESQNIPEAFTLMPVGLVKNKCVVCFF